MRPAVAVLLAACAPVGDDEDIDVHDVPAGIGAPGPHLQAAASPGVAIALPDDVAYLEECERRLGPLPALTCEAVEEVVQVATLDDGTVRTVRAEADTGPGGTCDRPSTLSACTPGSRAGVVRNEQGSMFWLLCRVRSFDTPAGWYDDIALIGRDEETEDTCFWGAPEDGRRREGSALPRPGSDEDTDGFWATVPELAEIGCRSCHDGNAVVVTPWIAANLPDHAPAAGLAFPYAAAFAEIDPTWAGTPRWVHPDAAPCRACHELPEGPTCTFGPDATGRLPDLLRSPSLDGWPTDRWMDDLDPVELVARHGTAAGWESTYGAAADRLLACCGGLREGCWEP